MRYTLLAHRQRVETVLTTWMARNGVRLLRISLGVVFFWFGVLKFFPGHSPAEQLAGDTIARISFGLLSPPTAVVLLAAWETFLGAALLFGFFLRASLPLFWLHMLGTVLTLFIFPKVCFVSFPTAPTLVGQYIIKNVVLITAGIVVGGTLGNGRGPGAPAGLPTD